VRKLDAALVEQAPVRSIGRDDDEFALVVIEVALDQR